MDVVAFLQAVQQHPLYDGQMAHCRELPARDGRFAVPSRPLPTALNGLLASRGIDQLYEHQVSALEAARAGRDWVVVTGTASGKTLCYNLPILESCLAEPHAGVVPVPHEGIGPRSAQGTAGPAIQPVGYRGPYPAGRLRR